MTNELDLLMKDLKKHEFLDSSDYAYFPEKFALTKLQYQALFKHLEEGYQMHHVPNKEGFPEYFSYFQYKRNKFIMRLLIGQGSACQFIKPNEDWEFLEGLKHVIKG
jgi:hypothetical protein